MCGADLERLVQRLDLAGSPPRVRSRRALRASRRSTAGITSACAEQTPAPCSHASPDWDHLRVCGADTGTLPAPGEILGSPPRVRSRHADGGVDGFGAGITSACAEQTYAAWRAARSMPDHLRVCGADKPRGTRSTPGYGSPPRVRSRRICAARMVNPSGITSACAEQTRPPTIGRPSCVDHLRVCGAD